MSSGVALTIYSGLAVLACLAILAAALLVRSRAKRDDGGGVREPETQWFPGGDEH